MLNPRIVDYATGAALASIGTNRRNSYRVGACLFKKKRVKAVAHNSHKTHPLLSTFSEWPCLHAESAAIVKYGVENCEGLDLCVVRVTKKNKLTMAKPCSACSRLIAEAGIRRVYYSNWDGDIICEGT